MAVNLPRGGHCGPLPIRAIRLQHGPGHRHGPGLHCGGAGGEFWNRPGHGDPLGSGHGGATGSKASLPFINIPHGWQGNGMFHGCNGTISEKSGHSINRNGHFTDGNGDLRIKTGTWTRVKIYIITT